ncbi:hypothetical protein BKA70DRAFT_1427774 [Coprinopsis sp. MPI-PUGE-AT-0042]|nr:hypothetical protein BKA70DRAFT_1427774 [Coprinopsis sp. MPI-PUGE-AT-0042]
MYLLCGICDFPFNPVTRIPTRVTCCNSVWCQPCIGKTLEAGRLCPHRCGGKPLRHRQARDLDLSSAPILEADDLKTVFDTIAAAYQQHTDVKRRFQASQESSDVFSKRTGNQLDTISRTHDTLLTAAAERAIATSNLKASSKKVESEVRTGRALDEQASLLRSKIRSLEARITKFPVQDLLNVVDKTVNPPNPKRRSEDCVGPSPKRHRSA